MARAAARRFAALAWVAFGVLVATGVWNLVALDDPFDGAYGVTLVMKLGLVASSAAVAHGRTRSRTWRAASGALSSLAAAAALMLGVQLGGWPQSGANAQVAGATPPAHTAHIPRKMT